MTPRASFMPDGTETTLGSVCQYPDTKTSQGSRQASQRGYEPRDVDEHTKDVWEPNQSGGWDRYTRQSDGTWTKAQ
ncbi:uncharacterized protein I303_105657 [Kwoniella dejecticola CBS 10117]|uniref:Uncharacterized protein n=1 Tax=Kwoniella dejecticola CBS 10117 TaxID=1296121 RepID=A0A1A6A014_9TREE|nr:uncharacterized protein I303_05679 [Kwoniella dejecticola CBS 10117]OBR83401.1 hypothetical protein I303_05679 [Kwoniella dejecticola CBS 10117]